MIGLLIGLPLGAILAIAVLAWFFPPETDEGPHYTTGNMNGENDPSPWGKR